MHVCGKLLTTLPPMRAPRGEGGLDAFFQKGVSGLLENGFGDVGFLSETDGDGAIH